MTATTAQEQEGAKPNASTELEDPAKGSESGTGTPAKGSERGEVDNEVLAPAPDGDLAAWKAYAQAIKHQADNRKAAMTRLGNERDQARLEVENIKVVEQSATLEKVQKDLEAANAATEAATKALADGQFENEWLKVSTEFAPKMTDADLALATLPRDKITFDEKTKRPTNLKAVLEEHLTAHKDALMKAEAPKPKALNGAIGNGAATEPLTMDAIKKMTSEEIIANMPAVRLAVQTQSQAKA